MPYDDIDVTRTRVFADGRNGANLCPLVAATARALQIHHDQIADAQSAIQVVSVSRAKLLVPFQDWRVLDRLRPDSESLLELCDTQQATGLYPFARRTSKRIATVEALQCPLRTGFQEGAATGVAAATLDVYPARYHFASQAGHHEIRIVQGYAICAPSAIEVIADCADAR